ncbi:hypothetical protein CBR_g39054 [Chara braunii]|uniref:Uncharacterized protein n=1 Tax=Chara braunii TaxID=69332 RepID=A0A388LQY3_CHABU|nr:hypothetical protein CBR_g39054 [Chara braunii]|eukprot:GBG84679.1 hypothetical protein CBR_g39054 [Chara braunii]
MSMAGRPRGAAQGVGMFITANGGGAVPPRAGQEVDKQSVDITFIAVSSAVIPPVNPPPPAGPQPGRPSSSLDVMSVQKTSGKKGWKAQKSIKAAPVVIKCKGCGRIKLPQFYCCGAPKLKSIEG